MTVKFENVTKIISKIVVANDVSFSWTQGKVYGLKGENGSGKTMLLRLMSGLIYPSSGSVYIDNRLLGKELDHPESIGILIETPAFLDGYTAIDNLRILSKINDVVVDEEIEDALLRVNLNPKDKRKYKKFSLGMKQRLGIAAAIFEKPELIILDEPTNALDADGIQLVKKIILEEKGRGALIVVASHDKEFIEFVSDELYEVKDGAIYKKNI